MSTNRVRVARNRDDRGFSLVETMIALTILSIGILSVGQLMVSSRRHSTYSRQETMAVSLAQEIKERIYSENFDDVKSIFDGANTDSSGTINTSTDEWAAHLADMLGSNGHGEIDVVDWSEDAGIPQDMYRVRIDVTWIEGPRNRSLTHQFMLSKVGL